jgi:hypothetical protein
MLRLASLSSNDLLSPSTSNFREFRDLVLTSFAAGESSPILGLFSRDWWLRRWAIQEIVVSSKATLLYGSLTLNFDIISQVMRFESLIRAILYDNGHQVFADLLQDHLGWQAARNMALTQAEFRTDHTVSFPRILYRFRSSRASDRRDAIWALLGFSTAIDIIPGYILPANEVFTGTARYIMTMHKNLDILSLCSAWKRSPPDPGPSWVPGFHDPSAMVPISLGVFGDRADLELFTAGGTGTPPLVSASSDPTLLILQGVVFDRILPTIELDPKNEEAEETETTCVRRFQFTLSQLSKLQSLIKRLPAGQASLEVFWRTVMADQWEPGERLKRLHLGGSTIPPTTKAEEIAFLAKSDLRSIGRFLEGRYFSLTCKGYPALVPEAATVGDIITVMPGGAVPYVLRPREEEGEYEFIGEW